MAVPLREAFRPGAELVREEFAHRDLTESGDRLGEHGAETGDRRRCGLVLGEVALDEFGQRPVPACGRERPEAHELERSVERVPGLALRLETSHLAAAAVIAVAVGPGAAVEALLLLVTSGLLA